MGEAEQQSELPEGPSLGVGGEPKDVQQSPVAGGEVSQEGRVDARPPGDSWIRSMERGFGETFDKFESTDERVREVLDRGVHRLESVVPDEEVLEAARTNLSNVRATDRDAFVLESIEAMKPVTEYRTAHYKEFQEASRRNFMEQPSFTPLNEVVAIDTEVAPGVIGLQIAPAEDVPNLRGVVEDGLRKLAERFRDDPELQKVWGKSWIVKEHPRLVERMGFTLEGENEVGMDRDTLLRRYG
jgi:hypothetical protein